VFRASPGDRNHLIAASLLPQLLQT
jgi:hypothetical protein